MFKIPFHEAGLRVVPISERADRHAPSQGGRLVTAPTGARGRPRADQQPIDRGGTHRQQPLAHLSIKTEMAVAFQGREQDGQ